MKYYQLFVLLCCLPLFSNAQSEPISTDDKMELGIHLPSLNYFGLVYKDQADENSFWRYRVAALQLNMSPSAPSANFQFNLAFSAGYENRRSYRDKLEFLYGPEFLFGFGGSDSFSNFFFGAGYVLGMQYQLPADFKIGLEIIPALQYSYNGNNSDGFKDYLNLNATSQTVFLFIVHQF